MGLHACFPKKIWLSCLPPVSLTCQLRTASSPGWRTPRAATSTGSHPRPPTSQAVSALPRRTSHGDIHVAFMRHYVTSYVTYELYVTFMGHYDILFDIIWDLCGIEWHSCDIMALMSHMTYPRYNDALTTALQARWIQLLGMTGCVPKCTVR